MSRKILFSVFSGIVYELDEKYTKNLDCGQLEITNHPKSKCKKCYGRGYESKDSKSGHFNLCKCTLKDASDEFLAKVSQHEVEDVVLHTSKNDTFDSVVNNIYS